MMLPIPKVIFWDFDGVLLDSNHVRDLGFRKVLADFPNNQVERLMAYHQANGGLSRYVKLRYFFEEVRGETVSDKEILFLAGKFSEVMRAELCKSSYLIEESLQYIEQNYLKIQMHIVSGSDQEELRYLCKQLNIDKYFKRIHGSPTPKSDWLKIILEEEGYVAETCVVIGDSINDYEAAISNSIFFKAFNNPLLESRTNEIFNIKLYR